MLAWGKQWYRGKPGKPGLAALWCAFHLPWPRPSSPRGAQKASGASPAGSSQWQNCQQGAMPARVLDGKGFQLSCRPLQGNAAARGRGRAEKEETQQLCLNKRRYIQSHPWVTIGWLLFHRLDRLEWTSGSVPSGLDLPYGGTVSNLPRDRCPGYIYARLPARIWVAKRPSRCTRTGG